MNANNSIPFKSPEAKSNRFTQNDDSSEKVKSVAIETVKLLNLSLSQAIDLQGRTKQAYWSAKGANLYGFQRMLRDFDRDLDSLSHQLASRIVTLGGTPQYIATVIASVSKLPPYPRDTIAISGHIDALVASYNQASSELLHTMKFTVANSDFASANIVSGLARILDEQASLLTGHIPEQWTATKTNAALG